MEPMNSTSRKDMLFSHGGLVANSALTGIGAAASVVAVSGLVAPALIVGAMGAGFGYLVTNQIRKEP